MTVQKIRQKLKKIENSSGGDSNPGRLQNLKNDEKSLRMFILRTSKYLSTADKEAIANILDNMTERVNEIIDEHDLHPREYLTTLSDFQSYIMSVTSVPETKEIDNRFRNVLRILRKLERTVKEKENDEETWAEKTGEKGKEKAKLTLEKGGEKQEMKVGEATDEQIDKSMEMIE